MERSVNAKRINDDYDGFVIGATTDGTPFVFDSAYDSCRIPDFVTTGLSDEAFAVKLYDAIAHCDDDADCL